MTDKEIYEAYKEAEKLGGSIQPYDFECPLDETTEDEVYKIDCNECPAGNACDFLSDNVKDSGYKTFLANYRAWYARVHNT